MNPAHEYLLEKRALSPAAKSALTMGAITAGTTVAAAVGTAALQDGVQSAHDTVARSIAYKKMLRDNPDLMDADAKSTRRYFNTMYQASPELARDPFASGSWVKKMVEYDYVDPQSLGVLAAAGSKMRDERLKSRQQAFNLAQGAVQAGASEYGRVKGQEFQFSQEEGRRKFELNRDAAKDRRQLKKDLTFRTIDSLADFGKEMRDDSRRRQERKEDRYFDDRKEYHRQFNELNKLDFQRDMDKWKAFNSPQALGYGVTRDEKGNPMPARGREVHRRVMDQYRKDMDPNNQAGPAFPPKVPEPAIPRPEKDFEEPTWRQRLLGF